MFEQEGTVMTYAGNQTAIVQIKSLVAGQLCYNTLEYGTEETGQYTTPAFFSAAWIAANLFELANVMSDQATVLSIGVSTTAPTGVPPYAPHIQTVNQAGNVVSQVLPPYSSYRVYKQPDNAAFEGTFGSAFRVGMIRFPGVPETYQQSGLVVPPGTAEIDTLATSLLEVDAALAEGVGSIIFRMIMVRREVGNPGNFGLAPLLTLSASNILGTQNSRKIT